MGLLSRSLCRGVDSCFADMVDREKTTLMESMLGQAVTSWNHSITSTLVEAADTQLSFRSLRQFESCSIQQHHCRRFGWREGCDFDVENDRRHSERCTEASGASAGLNSEPIGHCEIAIQPPNSQWSSLNLDASRRRLVFTAIC
jgi:hypothetical protein